MSSLSAVGRSAAARKNDRVSLCSFTFADGRRCRTPRIGKHPHFCFDHAEKEARARAAESLGKDLDYFFSGDYLSTQPVRSAAPAAQPNNSSSTALLRSKTAPPGLPRTPFRP